MEKPVILICSDSKTLKKYLWFIPVLFGWCETLPEIRDRLRRGKRGEKFHVFLFDETIELDLGEFLQMDNIAAIEICYEVGCSQRIKDDKIRYTSIDLCLSRWHYIEHKSSQSNAQNLARSGDTRQTYYEGKAQFSWKELMMVNRSSCTLTAIAKTSLFSFRHAMSSSSR